MNHRQLKEKLRYIQANAKSTEVANTAQDLLTDVETLRDPYTQRVKQFHREVEEHGDANYLDVLANDVLESDLALDDYPEVPGPARAEHAEVMAERNRLFWAAFLAEETGEVASCLTSGEPPESFRREVADALILCHAIADCFAFDMLQAFHEVMDKNDKKPKTQEGTGKLPAEARDEWRQDGE